MNCKRAIDLFDDYVEGTLPKNIREELDYHLAACSQCRTLLNTYTLTIRLSARIEKNACVSQGMLKRLHILLCERMNNP